MAFDPVTYAAINNLKREVGELILVPKNYNVTSPTSEYVETGKYYNSTDYPALFNICKQEVGLTSPIKIPRDSNRIVMSVASNGQGTIIYNTGSPSISNSNNPYIQLHTTNQYITFTNNSIWMTTDNETWTSYVIAPTFYPVAVGYLPNATGGPKFIAVSYLVSNGYYLSDDGITWVNQSFPANVTVATYTVGLPRSNNDSVIGAFSFMVGNPTSSLSRLLRTVDGINWDEALLCNGTGQYGAATVPTTHVGCFFNDTVISIRTQLNDTLGVDKSIMYLLGGRNNSNVWSSSTVLYYEEDFIDPDQKYISANQTRHSSPGDITCNDKVIIIAMKGYNSTLNVKPTSPKLFYSIDGTGWSPCVFKDNIGMYNYWSKVSWTGKYFLAIPELVGIGASITIAQSKTVAISYDGIEWEMIDIPDLYDNTTVLNIYSTGSTESFVLINDLTNSLLKNDTTLHAYSPYCPSPIPGTKYVIKAKL